MLKSSQIEVLLKSIPDGFLKPNDNFFVSSNAKLLQSYKKLGAISSAEIEELDEPAQANSNQFSLNNIYCNVLNCNLVFDDTASYTTHYNSMHRFLCQECRKSLPTEHLLDLHLSEKHDSYFQARLDRGERLYKCYVEECPQLFLNSAERKEHCVAQHKFPANFRFDQITHKNTATVPKKSSKINCEDAMELENEQPVASGYTKEVPIKNFSFGHQRERTFQLKNSSKTKIDSGKAALDNLDSLKAALDDS